MPNYQDQQVVNETIFREMNEWTKDGQVPRDEHSADGMDAYLCECSDARCTDPIQLTRPEYESIRSIPIRFAIALNHENPEVDRVVVENLRFATVEKLLGRGVRIARDTDPRR